ncbi:MCE family protein [Nocardioides marmotae]|uniref:MCE family protein n=1 Tax=Nocardioides marmotae TaxID=2663857 RepID=UPI001324EE8A|nr:MCE family protein [Nocardioides marmotae]MBC9731869.1 MCE family protein [Nocardioides marmotae]MTB82988.1 MCE family protein [Nocardioides marmotae]
MLVNVHHDTPAEHRRLLVAGVVFVTAIALLLWLSVAIYNKEFERSTRMRLEADRAGLQLAVNGDVRFHGVLVGRVDTVGQDGEQAVIDLALQPDAARDIPRNVRVEILPTTLFGQKYVSLVEPDEPSSEPVADGDVVPQDRVETNVELNRILANLFPLLRSVRPAELNSTLYALASALAGRGEEVGALLERLDGFTGRLADRLPSLERDLELIAEVSATYERATPDVLRLLRNATVSARTLVDQEAQLSSFIGDVTGMAETTTRVLAENEDGIIRLGELSRPLLRLLDTYAPQYPCLLKGLDIYTAKLSEIFKNDRVNQVLELGSVQKPAYDAGDRPQYGEVGHGPWCAGLPSPTGPNSTPLADGSDQDEIVGSTLPFRSIDPSTYRNPTKGYAGTVPEQRLVNVLLASEAGLSYRDLGSLSALLYGPQLRGTVVER